MIRFFLTHRFLGGVLLMLYAGLVLCGFLWKQNRYDDLAMRKAALVREVSALRGEVVLRNMENGELSSLERISKEAVRLGLGYENVPLKVKRVGRK